MFLVISLLFAFGIDFAIISIINDLLEPGIASIVFGAAILIVFSILAFALSYPLTARIFKKKEY